MSALLSLSSFRAGARRLRLATWLTSAFALLAATASASRGSHTFGAQDWKSQPPVLSSVAQTWVDWVELTQAGEYERSGGPPLDAPTPPGFPSDVTDCLLRYRAGSYETTSGGVVCRTDWSETYIWMRFGDGSEFFWHDDRYDRRCADGSTESYHQVISSGGFWDPVTGASYASSRSYTRTAFSVQRKASFRASAGAVMPLSIGSDGLPLISYGTEAVDVTVAPGGVLDLQNQPPGSGPLFRTNGPVTIRCDQILLDPGVQLADLFQPPPIVLPAAVVHEVALLGAPAEHVAPFVDIEYALYLVNLGNVPEPAQLSWSDTAGWVMPGTVPLAGGLGAGRVSVQDLSFVAPPGLQVGDASQLTVQLASPIFQFPVTYVTARVDRVGVPAAPTTYCTPSLLGSRNGNLQLAEMEVTGHATLTGDDDFVIAARETTPSKDAFFYYGLTPANIPFHGGTLCVGSALGRGRATSYAVALAHRRHHWIFGQSQMEEHALLPGMQVYGQFVARPSDPHLPPVTSAAIAFTIGP